MKKFVGVAGVLLLATFLHAQPGCPSVNAGNDVALPCGTNCTNLTATAFPSGNTTSYSVSQIPYTPFSYTAGTPILINIDDTWSGIINLPFTFCFFGNAYTQVVVGSNGIITFDINEANGYCDWDLTGSGTLPTTNVFGNCIMGPYHDIDPSLGGTIKYQIIGTAPCRIFIISYYQVPMYESDNFLSTCSGMDATHQIAIYETTNAIEVYIQHKDACPDGGFFTPGWNDGLAIEGIQNASQTIAYTVPGRNNTVWTANNDAWRFTPNGPSIVTVDWFQGGNQIGTGNTVNVCPGSNTTYTARATYLPCSGGTPVVVNDDVNVTLAGALQAGIDSSRNVSCNGANNGAAFASASTSNSGLTYGWSNGAGTLSITGLAPGTYIFTATDASACVRADTVIITQPAPVTANVPDVSQINCSGTGTGTLTATPGGGTPPYFYLWNSVPPQADSLLDGVNPGTYTVTVSDSKGCTATDNGTLTITTGGNNVVLGNAIITNVFCNGGNNGSIMVSASGGSGSYTYTWSSGQTGASATSLTAGQYTVSVDDGAGCTVSGTYNVTQPAPLLIDSADVVNIGCGGALAGSITVFVSGGTPNYGYSWVQQSNSQSYATQTIGNLSPDTYNLTVTDFRNCSVTASYQITQVPVLSFTQSSANVTCNGGNNGSATITVSSGTPPYSYNWNGTGPSGNSTLTGVSAGIVNVTVSDPNCTATATFNITEPPAISVTLLSQTNVTCNGGNNGSITISAGGGTPPLVCAWSNLQTGFSATGLSAGSITAVVTDANSCTVSQTYTISEPSALVVSTTSTDATCFLAPNGSADVTVSGGTSPYTYLWSDGQPTASATSLVAGSYTCTVTDANFCTATASALVNEPQDMIISASATAVKCIGDANGTISVSATGGTPPYNFSATQDFTNFVFATNGVIQGLAVGVYTVIVADDNGCTKTILVTVPDASPDNFTTSTDSTSCYGDDYNDGGAHIIATSVQNSPYQYGIDGGPLSYSGDFYNLSAGSHTITAVNFNGCTSTVPVFVLEPLPIVVDVVPDTVILPLGESAPVQVVYLNASGVSYLWEPPTGLSCMDCPDPTVSVYHRGDYVVTVSSLASNGSCFGTATLHVEVEPHKPVFIPNSFTPNGDGNNDRFLIFGEDIKTVDLKIFDRWGELVFKTNNMLSGWDGTYRGQLSQPAVFTYTAKVTFLDDKTFEKYGSIALIR